MSILKTVTSRKKPFSNYFKQSKVSSNCFKDDQSLKVEMFMGIARTIRRLTETLALFLRAFKRLHAWKINFQPKGLAKMKNRKKRRAFLIKLCFSLYFVSFWLCTSYYQSSSTYLVIDYTAATFGHENTTNSIAFVDILNPAPFRSGVDISMFIRTREESGFIFYFGSDLHHPQESYITGQLVKGNLVVNVTFDGKTERFQVRKKLDVI
jgi:hypothetical protein